MSRSVSEMVDIIFLYYPRVRKTFRNLVSIKDVPISMTQLTCLNALEKNETISMSELAEELSMSNQQLTKVVDGLVEFGMAERFIDPSNRRKIFVRMSEHGRNTVTSLKREVDRKLSFVLHKMSHEDVDKLYDAIETLVGFFGYDKVGEKK